MVSGLMDDTPLGRIVGIRSETNRDILKQFTPEQNRIQAEWFAYRSAKAAAVPDEDKKKQMNQLEHMIAGLFGGR